MKKNNVTCFVVLLASLTLLAEMEASTTSPIVKLFDQKAQSKVTSLQPYKAKNFSYLLGMEGFTDEALKLHFTLYEGYVNNTNLLLSILQQYAEEGKDRTPQYAEIKRRLGWEFDGMRLHEYYFYNLGGAGTQLNKAGDLAQRIENDYGSLEAWKKDFLATGALRGVGWVVLYLDPIHGRLMNIWVDEHDIGNLAGGNPILVMDVWEHAYILDYGLDRMDYFKAFFDNINWDIVESRYST